MDREDILRKIRRCMALSKSANQHEAAAALRQMQALAAQIQLDQTGIEILDVKEAVAPAKASKVQAYEANLVSLIADAFGCEHFLRTGYRRPPGGSLAPYTDFVFVGVDPAHELAVYAFQVLQRQLLRQRAAHVAKQPGSCKPSTKTARGDAFAMGWVTGVQALVDRLAGGERNVEAVQKYLERNHPDLGTAKLGRRDVGRNSRETDYAAGHSAGKRAQLHAGLGGREPQRLLGSSR